MKEESGVRRGKGGGVVKEESGAREVNEMERGVREEG